MGETVESARIAALHDLDLLDTAPERGFDDVVRLATMLCQTPVALVSLVDRDRQWFKARVGFPQCETDLDRSVCRFVVQSSGLVVIPDLTKDERTSGNPLVTHNPAIRFYAGAPLTTPEGHVLGALCVIDTKPRPEGLTAEQSEGLWALARQTVDAIRTRMIIQQRESAVAERERMAWERDALLRLGDTLRDCSSEAEMIQSAAEIVGTTLGASRAGYGNIDESTEHIAIGPDWTAPGVASIQGDYRFSDFGRIRDELARGEPLIIQDVLTDARTAPDPWPMVEVGIGALINVPVRDRGHMVGAFIVHAATARDWTFAELAFVRNVADRLEAGLSRVRAEAQQEVLNGEILHRLKNSLAMVQSIANQTFRGRAEGDALQTFSKRIQALGTAQDVLLARNLTSADLKNLLERVLAAAGASDYVLSGPPVRCGARASQSTSLVIHELATNAIKYGALSHGGSVAVTWQESRKEGRRLLLLEWAERGGPPASKPERTGFGTRLLKLGLLGNGGSDMRYGPEGFSATFSVDLELYERPIG